eukprot:202778_1
MAQAASHCNHSGCYCKGYVIPQSKWSKGKCKNCDHSQKEHGEIVADITFDDNTTVAPPDSSSTNTYNAQIDNKMGIAPSGTTNFKGGGGAKSSQPSIYSVTLDEKDWINWSVKDLLIWLQQKKRFPSELDLNGIEHEMEKNKVNGAMISRLTHSTMLSYGFKEYEHRQKLLNAVKKLLEEYPPSTQTPKYVPQQAQQQENKPKKEEQKQPEISKDESALLKEANLNESEWKSWNCDQVWQWLSVKQGWTNTDDFEYMFVHKLMEYEQKLKSKEVELTGIKLGDVANDMKNQKLLKAIG